MFPIVSEKKKEKIYQHYYLHCELKESMLSLLAAVLVEYDRD